jgi:hypothetical protein
MSILCPVPRVEAEAKSETIKRYFTRLFGPTRDPIDEPGT